MAAVTGPRRDVDLRRRYELPNRPVDVTEFAGYALAFDGGARREVCVASACRGTPRRPTCSRVALPRVPGPGWRDRPRAGWPTPNRPSRHPRSRSHTARWSPSPADATDPTQPERDVDRSAGRLAGLGGVGAFHETGHECLELVIDDGLGICIGLALDREHGQCGGILRPCR